MKVWILQNKKLYLSFSLYVFFSSLSSSALIFPQKFSSRVWVSPYFCKRLRIFLGLYWCISECYHWFILQRPPKLLMLSWIALSSQAIDMQSQCESVFISLRDLWYLADPEVISVSRNHVNILERIFSIPLAAVFNENISSRYQAAGLVPAIACRGEVECLEGVSITGTTPLLPSHL